MVIGALAFRIRLVIGVVGIAAFGVVGSVAALSRRLGGSPTDVTPTVVGAAAGVGALLLAHRTFGAVLERRRTTDTAARSGPPVTRRHVVVRGGALLGMLTLFGAGAAAVGRAVVSRFSAAESRAAVVLPPATEPLAPVPAGVSVDVPGVAAFVTPNADFYRIDTALTVPQVPTEGYELRVLGMVDRPLRLSYDDLLSRDVVEYDITLTCVSNTIGGELIGNARWLGVRLDELLEDAGVKPGADQVVGRSIDGYTCGFPIEAATDGRNALVAFGMNGEPLPLEHGFPVRLIVPGLYGYISATKWLTEIELTTFADFEQYWVPRGYADRAPIKLMSRIDSIDGLGTLVRDTAGVAAIGGVAWAQTRGIGNVEVQIDEGEWQPAELGTALNDDTWRQWAYRWTPSSPGRTTIRCRATDRQGVIQTPERAEPLPNGASGHHEIVVFVE
jgi:DMSO/TMAO reductase YedYZ molybdopterin-dependent catalytic subunit